MKALLLSDYIVLWFTYRALFFLRNWHIEQKNCTLRRKIYNIIIGALGSTWGHDFYMGRQSLMSIKTWWSRIFDSHLWIKVMACWIVSHTFIWGSHTFAMFSAHALREWVWPHSHIYLTTFTRFAQNWNRVPACIVWLFYACSYTVALSPGIIPIFAVLHTEKLAFQWATLLSWVRGRGWGYESSCAYQNMPMAVVKFYLSLIF